jgi:hypothetical protein
MLRSATALLTALAAGWVLFGSATSASAGDYSPPSASESTGDCGECGPRPPIYRKHVIYKHTHVTRHHPELVIKPVPRKQRIIDVTEIQPVKHVHDVYDVTIKRVPGPVYNVYEHETRRLPEQVIHTSSKVYHHVGCGCGY